MGAGRPRKRLEGREKSACFPADTTSMRTEAILALLASMRLFIRTQVGRWGRVLVSFGLLTLAAALSPKHSHLYPQKNRNIDFFVVAMVTVF